MQPDKKFVEDCRSSNHEPGKIMDFPRALVERADTDAGRATHVILRPKGIAEFPVDIPFENAGMTRYIRAHLCHFSFRDCPGRTAGGTDFTGFTEFNDSDRTECVMFERHVGEYLE